MAENFREERADRPLLTVRGVKLLLIFLLVVSVIVEGYYIYLLQDRIAQRTDELKNISVELQFLKNERETLKETLSSAKRTGDNGNGNSNGNTPER